jgi:TRAP-type mannitol/chloroaromatic compound transport system permease small subunit
MVLLLIFGAQEAWHAWEIGERSDASPWRPIIYPFKAVIPLTALLLLVQGISEFLKSLYAIRTGRHYAKREVAAEL